MALTSLSARYRPPRIWPAKWATRSRPDQYEETCFASLTTSPWQATSPVVRRLRKRPPNKKRLSLRSNRSPYTRLWPQLCFPGIRSLEKVVEVPDELGRNLRRRRYSECNNQRETTWFTTPISPASKHGSMPTSLVAPPLPRYRDLLLLQWQRDGPLRTTHRSIFLGGWLRPRVGKRRSASGLRQTQSRWRRGRS